MSILVSRRVVLALGACVVGITAVAACGDSGPSVGDGTVATASPSLQAIRAAASPASISARSSAGDAESTAPAADATSLRMAWIHYSIGGELTPLPPVATAWTIVPGGAVDAGRMETIARAFGITEPLVEIPADEGGGWRAGPADGTAPSVTFPRSPTLDWYFSPAWAALDDRAVCEEVKVAEEATAAEGSAEGPVSTAPGAEGADPDAPTADTVSVVPVPIDGEGGGDSAVHCPAPTPPEGVPSDDEALESAADLLEAAGLDPDAFEMQVDGDEWGRYVTAFPLLDGLRSPLATSFGFGAQGAVTWAGGSLATPTRAGDYPLISVTEGVERLNEQSAWWGRDVLAVDGGAAQSGASTDEGASPVDTDPAVTVTGSDTVEPVEPGAGEPIEVSVTGVRADLTVIWDVDDTVWLLPAYTYTNSDGIVATVAAVTDDYLVYPDVPAAETVDPAESGEAASDDPSVVSEPPDVVGLNEDEATRLATGAGWTVRVVSIDGVDQAVTADLRSDRINLTLESGRVVSVSVG